MQQNCYVLRVTCYVIQPDHIRRRSMDGIATLFLTRKEFLSLPRIFQPLDKHSLNTSDKNGSLYAPGGIFHGREKKYVDIVL